MIFYFRMHTKNNVNQYKNLNNYIVKFYYVRLNAYPNQLQDAPMLDKNG